jgi:hypothetical protein
VGLGLVSCGKVVLDTVCCGKVSPSEVMGMVRSGEIMFGAGR